MAVQCLEVAGPQGASVETVVTCCDQGRDVVPDPLLDRGRVGQCVVEIEEDAADQNGSE
jgi:hypothetical protein